MGDLEYMWRSDCTCVVLPGQAHGTVCGEKAGALFHCQLANFAHGHHRKLGKTGHVEGREGRRQETRELVHA